MCGWVVQRTQSRSAGHLPREGCRDGAVAGDLTRDGRPGRGRWAGRARRRRSAPRRRSTSAAAAACAGPVVAPVWAPSAGSWPRMASTRASTRSASRPGSFPAPARSRSWVALARAVRVSHTSSATGAGMVIQNDCIPSGCGHRLDGAGRDRLVVPVGRRLGVRGEHRPPDGALELAQASGPGPGPAPGPAPRPLRGRAGRGPRRPGARPAGR